MKRNQPVKLNAPSLLMALTMANEYFTIGVSQHNKFAGQFKQGLAAGGQMTREESLAAIPAGTILAFSIELYLKVLLVQFNGAHPPEHRLDKLVDALPAAVVVSLAKRYADAREGLNLLAFDITGGNAQQPPPEKAGADTFTDAVAKLSNLFVKLRYFHEDFSGDLIFRFDFFWFFQLATALQAEIASVKGGQVVRFKGPAG